MYDPQVGRWLTIDPEGFDAGDYNLYRYCANDPMNRTDPTGLASVWGVVEPGKPIPAKDFGGGVVTFPDGKKGTIKVSTGATVGVYLDTYVQESAQQLILTMGAGLSSGSGSFNSAALLQGWRGKYKAEYPNATLTHKPAIIIEYTGPYAKDIDFIQTEYSSLSYTLKNEKQRFWETGEIEAHGFKRKILGDPKHENNRDYYLDAGRNPMSPVISTLIRGEDFKAFPDAPNTSISILSKFLFSDFVTKTIGADFILNKNIDKFEQVTATNHFDTYLIYKGKPLYRVSWESRWTLPEREAALKSRDEILSPSHTVTGGEANPKLSDKQIKEIKSRFPKQTVIDLN